MKKEEQSPIRFESLSDAHRAMGFPQPKHPLISLINSPHNDVQLNMMRKSHVLSFYKISYKPKLSGKIKYGQGYYDFDEGGLLFASPNQVIGSDEESGGVCSEYTLVIHPDFFWNFPLAKKIRQYGFFSYSTNEALHLSEDEKATIMSIFEMIAMELNSRIDDFSQDVVVAQIELLLNYANRFYKRQFLTRKVVNNDLLQKLEDLLEDYFNQEKTLTSGLPSVSYLADQLNLSSSYLSDMLRSLTGLNAQQHIHEKLTVKAKEILSTTSLSASEIAYKLGFEHPQSFTRFFKSKTSLSPLEFRQTFKQSIA